MTNAVSLSPSERRLLTAALEATRRAYAPYSGFSVGAAAETSDGVILVGANMENASYGLTICAEVAVLAAANSQGRLAQVTRMAITGRGFHPEPRDGGIIAPCGRCRQVIAEASQLGGRDIEILCANSDLSEVLHTSIGALLPHAFGPAALGLDSYWPAMRKNLDHS